MLEVHQLLTNAAREGGRLATGGAPEQDIKDHVQIYLENAGLPTTTVSAATITSDDDATTADGTKAYKITISLPASKILWVPLPLVTNADSKIVAESFWVRD